MEFTAISKCYLLFIDACKIKCTLHIEREYACILYIFQNTIDIDTDTKLIISISKESDSKLKF